MGPSLGKIIYAMLCLIVPVVVALIAAIRVFNAFAIDKGSLIISQKAAIEKDGLIDSQKGLAVILVPAMLVAFTMVHAFHVLAVKDFSLVETQVEKDRLVESQKVLAAKIVLMLSFVNPVALAVGAVTFMVTAGIMSLFIEH